MVLRYFFGLKTTSRTSPIGETSGSTFETPILESSPKSSPKTVSKIKIFSKKLIVPDHTFSYRDLQQTRESNKSTICAHKFQAHQLKFGTTPSRTTTRFKDTPSVKFLKFSLNCSPLSLSHWPWIEPPNPWDVYHGYKSTLHQEIWIYCWISIGWLSLPPPFTIHCFKSWFWPSFQRQNTYFKLQLDYLVAFSRVFGSHLSFHPVHSEIDKTSWLLSKIPFWIQILELNRWFYLGSLHPQLLSWKGLHFEVKLGHWHPTAPPH